MLEKFKNKKVLICIAQYAAAYDKIVLGAQVHALQRQGIVTNIDDNFIELDNNEVIAIKYIATIKSI